VHAHTTSSAGFSTGDPMPDVKTQELIFDTAEAYRTGDNYNEATLRYFFRRSLAIPSLSVPSIGQLLIKQQTMRRSNHA
jgi:hypothetical protein